MKIYALTCLETAKQLFKTLLQLLPHITFIINEIQGYIGKVVIACWQKAPIEI